MFLQRKKSVTGNTNELRVILMTKRKIDELIFDSGPVFVPALFLSACLSPSLKSGQVCPLFHFLNSSGLKFMISANITASLSDRPLQIADAILLIAFGELYGSAM